MRVLLQLKHWQLFIVLIVMPLVMDFIFIGTSIFSNNDPSPLMTIFLIVIIFSLCIFFAWFYALGTNLHKKLPGSVEMNLTKFKIFLVIPFLFILFVCLLMLFMINNSIAGKEPPTIGVGILGILLPVDLFSFFCIFYCLYFNAKVLKAVELQREVSFEDYVGEFFLIWFFPIGLWFIQPKVNKLFAVKNGLPHD